MVGFKKVVTKITKPKDPELLFHDLRSRSPDIQHLWAHQADLIRSYSQSHLNTKDISFELPTGTGKTLIGLLLGEWRRIFFEERVLYLCPTRQLAHQVHNQASKYGIDTYVFVGKGSSYPVTQFSEYEAGKAIAISTYSGLFNSNPRLNSANIIILDDAHAAESYIVSMWSLDINRFDNRDLFFEIISLFEDKLPRSLVDYLKDDNASSIHREHVDMIPAPHFWECHNSLREILDKNTDGVPDLFFTWSIIRENLAACNMFVSWLGILIRPWIPPSLSHAPFANATQRIFMSATLGAGGELERIIGVPRIERLPIPTGWDKQGSGRRFFIFPNYSFDPEQYSPWLAKLICEKDRTLVLCPDREKASLVKELIKQKCETLSILNSDDIEDSLSPFTSKNNTALILTNRYDGIDLPGDACRQLIIAGLPEAVNLQERFLLRRLGIFSVLRDRIVTRFTQAVGRCTRGATDYSLVILEGQRLFDFCIKNENRVLMHPEIQAELEFGRKQSEVANIENLTELIELFYKQETDWKDAEKNIEELREDVKVQKDPRSNVLNLIVKHEVDYQYYLWKGDYNQAMDSARKVADQLSGNEFEGYRALWNYFGGSTAWILSQKNRDENYQKTAKDLFTRAKSCSKTVSWFSELPDLFGIMKEGTSLDQISGYAIERIQQKLSNLGGTGKRFEEEMTEIQKLIENDEPAKFENGLTELGELLGFSAEHPKGKAPPDSVWKLADTIVLIFEAKSKTDKDGKVSIDSCREAKGHYNWAEQYVASFNKVPKKFCIIIDQRTKLDKDAVPKYAESLYYMHIGRIREIFKTIDGVLTRIRNQYMKYDDEEIRFKIFDELKQNKLDPESLIAEIENKPLSNLPLE